MICDSCKKNEANVHITKIVNGIKEELNLCEKCAKERTDFNPQIDFSSAFTFQNMLAGIMEYISDSSENKSSFDIICENCGTSYLDFKNRGFMGCSECYTKFSSSVMPVVKRIQGNIEHTGKIPKRLGESLIEKRKLTKLKHDLKKAVVDEEYEKAAELRDLIKETENKNK